ncbi:uncharacterized protein LOC119597588 [Penaeus monodon]|uniref:uncharacterized protein LOC119597588 n=1 Tax=Penaeus monodon TaxID=6687 RepID=UPI0018A717F1|nr:uncharacterized protein LOC119597588 [Penaeus monodon]
MAMAVWKISVAALLVVGSAGRTRGAEALCSEGQTKTYTCSNPVLTFNSTGTGIDLVLNVTNNRRRESLPIRIHRTPEGLNISSLIIPDEGKVEFRIKTHFVEVMNSGSPQRVFKNDQKQIWFYEFSAPSGVRICVACDNEDILDQERPKQSSTSDHQNTEQENTFTTEDREQENTFITEDREQENTLTTEDREQENTLTTEDREQENTFTTESREQEKTFTSEKGEQENTSAMENTEQHRKSGSIVTASSVKEESEDNRSWWWLLLIPACVILVVYLHARHRQSSRYSVRNAQASQAAEREGAGTPDVAETNGGGPYTEEKTG